MTTDRITFVVPGPPIPCARSRVFVDRSTGRTRAARPGRTANYEAHFRSYAQTAALLARWRVVDGSEYALTLRVFRDARRGDWDNYGKAASDAMNGVIYADDRHITSATVILAMDRERPRVEVEIEQRRPS